LDDDRIHLPITVRKVYVQQAFCNTQMSSRTDGQELGQAFNNSKDQ
jgi:hypothetical protein